MAEDQGRLYHEKMGEVRRSDRVGAQRTAFEKNARYIYKTQDICGICGLPVDKELKSPDPMSKTVDHIIPVSKGGHPSDLSNLQLAHRCCNRQKGDRLFVPGMLKGPGVSDMTAHNNPPGSPAVNRPTGPTRETLRIDNDNLPQHADWSALTWN